MLKKNFVTGEISFTIIQRLHQIIEQAQKLYPLEGCILTPVSGHEGGRNRIFIVSRNGIKQYVLRISDIGDRSEADYIRRFIRARIILTSII